MFKINNIPVIERIFKSGPCNTVLCFSRGDFESRYFDADVESMEKINITNLPNYGVLKLNSVPAEKDQEITPNNIDDLEFVPETEWSGETEFSWKAYDGTDYSNLEYVLIEIKKSFLEEWAKEIIGGIFVTVVSTAIISTLISFRKKL